MPYKLENPYRHKFPRTKYRVSNWSECNESLKTRGSLTIWFSEDAISTWHPEVSNKKKGGQIKYSDLAIEESTGEIISSELTTNRVSDNSQVTVLLEKIKEDIASFAADGTYDKPDVYDYLEKYNPDSPYTVIIPPRKDCNLSKYVETNPIQ